MVSRPTRPPSIYIDFREWDRTRRFRRVNHLCVGCGVPRDENNPKCNTCRERHKRRKTQMYGQGHHVIRVNGRKRYKGPCSGGCGILDRSKDDYTPGCPVCFQRKWARDKSLEQRLTLALSLL